MTASTTHLSIRVASNSILSQHIAGAFVERPARMIEAGQPLSSRSLAVHARSFCVYDSPLPSETHPEEHIAWAVDFLTRAQEQHQEILTKCEIDLRLGFATSSGQGAFGIGASALILLGKLGVQLNVDLYSFETREDATNDDAVPIGSSSERK